MVTTANSSISNSSIRTCSDNRLEDLQIASTPQPQATPPKTPSSNPGSGKNPAGIDPLQIFMSFINGFGWQAIKRDIDIFKEVMAGNVGKLFKISEQLEQVSGSYENFQNGLEKWKAIVSAPNLQTAFNLYLGYFRDNLKELGIPEQMTPQQQADLVAYILGSVAQARLTAGLLKNFKASQTARPPQVVRLDEGGITINMIWDAKKNAYVPSYIGGSTGNGQLALPGVSGGIVRVPPTTLVRPPSLAGIRTAMSASPDPMGLDMHPQIATWAAQALVHHDKPGQLLRLLGDIYRAEIPGAANRRALIDNLLPSNSGTPSGIGFVEIHGVLTMANQFANHEKANEFLGSIVTLAKEVATELEFDDVGIYHLGGARFAFEGDFSKVSLLVGKLQERIANLRVEVVKNGDLYAQVGMPVDSKVVPAPAGVNRAALVEQQLKYLNDRGEEKRGTKVPAKENRGDVLPTMQVVEKGTSRTGFEVRPNDIAKSTDDNLADIEVLITTTTPSNKMQNVRMQDSLPQSIQRALQGMVQAIPPAQSDEAIVRAAQRAYGSKLVGSLLNGIAMRRLMAELDAEGRKPVFIAGDIAGLSSANLHLGEFAGDTLLAAVYSTIENFNREFKREHKLTDKDLAVGSDGGDELLGVAPNQRIADLYIAGLQKALTDSSIQGIVHRPDGTRIQVGFGKLRVYLESSEESLARAGEKVSDTKARDTARVEAKTNNQLLPEITVKPVRD